MEDLSWASKPLQKWSDEEIRQALRRHNVLTNIPPITPFTRGLLESKLQAWLGRTTADEICIVNSPTDNTSSNASEGSLSVVKTPSDPVEGYYGVVGPNTASLSAAPQLSPFYICKSDALKATRSIPGARFKRFNSQAEAEAFSTPQQPQLQDDSLEQIDFQDVGGSSTSNEKVNDFPSVKTPEYNKFRMMIETGEINSFVECIEANPRYLISPGDSPPLLKVSVGYNALHCAVKSKQLEICQHLLNVVQSDVFWQLIYSDDTEEVRLFRKKHLLDLYLNMVEKGLAETPLHFACKFGYKEIVSFLLSFPLTNTTISNKYGQTPADVVCDKAEAPADVLKESIKNILKEPKLYFVSVLRTEDNCTPPRLGKPSTLEQLGQETLEDELGLPMVSNGLAGPMSPCDANRFYHDWKTPSDSDQRKKNSLIKRSDSERGLERVGRQLAHERKVGWEEYWEFLGFSCDLSKPDGCQLLEEYLQRKYSQDRHGFVVTSPTHVFNDSLENDPAMLSESPLYVHRPKIVNSSSADSPVGKLFTDDSEGFTEGADAMDITQKDEINCKQRDSNTNEIDGLPAMLAEKLSLVEVVLKSEGNALYIIGTSPTKLDHNVLLALGDVRPDRLKYPCINKWIDIVRSFPEEKQTSWCSPRRKQHGILNLDHTPSPLPVSQLVLSSPSASAPVNRHPYGGNSSPLVTSESSSNRSVLDTKNVTTTPTQQHTLAQRPFWQRQSTPPVGRHIPVSIRISSTNTTPGRRGQTMRMTRFTDEL